QSTCPPPQERLDQPLSERLVCTSSYNRPTLQPLLIKPPQYFHLLLLIAARHQNQELLRNRTHWLRVALQHFRGGGFPGGGEGVLVRRSLFQQALVQLLLRFGQGGERIDGEEKRASFIFSWHRAGGKWIDDGYAIVVLAGIQIFAVNH